MNIKQKNRNKFLGVVALALMVGVISYPRVLAFWPKGEETLNKLKINLGLDLQGGIHLEYKADMSQVEDGKQAEALQGAQDVIERRVNAFGVGEPIVYTSQAGSEQHVIVELPGIKDIEEAKKRIQDMPILEFKEETDKVDPQIQKMFDQQNEQTKTKAGEALQRALSGEDFGALAKELSQDPGSKDKGGDLDFVKKGALVPEFDKVLFDSNLKNGEIYSSLVETQFGWHIIKFIEARGEGDDKEVHAAHILFAKMTADSIPDLKYASTGLTGKNLKSAAVAYSSQGLGEPKISIQFDEEGTKLFADVTKRNIGKRVAIYLDGKLQMEPTVQVAITDGSAEITGQWTLEEVKNQVRRLNEGSIPVPLTLVGQQSIEASLGEVSLQKSLRAGAIGLILVVIFMLVYYRFLGLIASLALLVYTGIMVAIFKLSALTPFQVTLTLSGIAGFIISIGMAVDANILIFERTKEEIRRGRTITGALDEGFKRAWTSIRDGNVSSIITSVILYSMGTGFVKGFALTLLLGVVVSMFTAIVVSRTILKFLVGEWIHNKTWLVGVNKKDIAGYKE
jgi:protein-export membrane protein SecD